ncbi:MAG: N-acetylglucosaminyl deacetylase, LmbE family [Candidatus Levybacteria bacterium]|nr:N-acetylglucosaminyl deacetylase, LmbE family [Candidatus Levybacteria bacterium]
MKKRVVLAVGAHPDDMELFGASGTLAKFAEKGDEVYLIICTDGSRGSEDPQMTHARLAEIRKKEQKNAGNILGIKKIFFLNHTDTQLICDLKLKKEIVKIIRTVRPDTVITLDPALYYSTDFIYGFNFINHTDHRAAGLAAMDAVFPLSRDRLTFPEHEKAGLKSHKVKELWMVSFDKIGHVVDISKTIEKKIKALSMHSSQFANFSMVEKMVRERAKMLGEKKGFKFAENFVRLNLP